MHPAHIRQGRGLIFVHLLPLSQGAVFWERLQLE